MKGVNLGKNIETYFNKKDIPLFLHKTCDSGIKSLNLFSKTNDSLKKTQIGLVEHLILLKGHQFIM